MLLASCSSARDGAGAPSTVAVTTTPPASGAGASSTTATVFTTTVTVFTTTVTVPPTTTTTVDPRAWLTALPDLPPPGDGRRGWVDEVRRAVAARPDTPVEVTIDDAGDAVLVAVAAGRVDLLYDLRDRYSGLVSYRVGDQAYPTPATIWPGTTCPWAIAEGPRQVGGLRATVALVTATVTSGSEFDARVRVTNTGTVRRRFYADSTLHGYVVRPGTTEVIGVSTRYPALGGSGGDLEPGESKEFDALLGTTSCDPSLGPVLPPGTYEVLVPVDPSPMGSTVANDLVSEPVTLVVTG